MKTFATHLKITLCLGVALMASANTARAATLYWVGDASAAFYAESNWSTSPTNAALEPAGDPVTNAADITDDLVISDTYNGSSIANTPGGGPVDDMSSGVSPSIQLSANTVTLSNTTLRVRDNSLIDGDASNKPTLNLDGGAILSAEAVQNVNAHLDNTSQLLFWGTGDAVFTGSTFDFLTLTSSLRLKNISFGTDISAKLANATGFAYQGSAITTADLLIANDGAGGTLISVKPVPTPAALPAGLLLLTASLGAIRRHNA